MATVAALAITGGSVREAAAGETSTLTFTLTREGDLSAPLEVPWVLMPERGMRSIVGGLFGPYAEANAEDFGGVQPGGTASFAAGAASAVVAITVAGDDAPEWDERFLLQADGAEGAGVVLTDETWFFIENHWLTVEGELAHQMPTHEVRRLGRTDLPATVDFAVAGSDPTPVDAADFVGGALPAGTLSFAPGITGMALPMVLALDGLTEADEMLQITLSAAAMAGGAEEEGAGTALVLHPTTAVTVQNDDRPEGDPAGDAGTTATIAPGEHRQDRVVLTRDRDWYRAEMVAGETYRIVLQVVSPGSEFGQLVLRNAQGAVLASAHPTMNALAVIEATYDGGGPWFIDVGSSDHLQGWWNVGDYELAMDRVSVVNLVAAQPAVAEGAAGEHAVFTFTATRSTQLDTALVLPWRVTAPWPRQALAADFPGGTPPSGTLAFAPGQTEATLVVETLGNDLVQGNREFRLVLNGEFLSPYSALSHAGVAPATVAVVILEDEAPEPSLVAQTTAGAAVEAAPAWSRAPVQGVDREFVALSAEDLRVAAQGPGWFLRTGDGDDAIAAASGTNVLDGGGGSNFLAGGSGVDHFFLDLRGRVAGGAETWTTIAGAAPGDTVSVWGVDFSPEGGWFMEWELLAGAPGWQGATLHLSRIVGYVTAVPVAHLTLAGVGGPGMPDWAGAALPDGVGAGVLLRIV